jgi:cytochrome b subunit of formate dehydrogenase
MDWIWTVILILLVIWVAGLLLKIGGKIIHLILLIALSLFLLNFFGII